MKHILTNISIKNSQAVYSKLRFAAAPRHLRPGNQKGRQRLFSAVVLPLFSGRIMGHGCFYILLGRKARNARHTKATQEKTDSSLFILQYYYTMSVKREWYNCASRGGCLI